MVPRISTVELPILELTRDAITTALTLNKEQQTVQKHFQYQELATSKRIYSKIELIAL
ncbi:hypothetical protein P4S64_15955 [Vibrio sp. M60_M31a]